MAEPFDAETRRRKLSALGTLLDQLAVPPARVEPLSHTNLRWLSRNLPSRNKDHPMFDTVRELLKQLLRDDARRKAVR